MTLSLDNSFIRLQMEARQRWKDVPIVILSRRVNFLRARIAVEKRLFIDVYYNAMNGTFVPLDEDQVMYVFGHFDVKRERHRVNAVVLSWV